MAAGFRSPFPYGLAIPAAVPQGGFRLPVFLGVSLPRAQTFGFRAPVPFALLGVPYPAPISIVLPADVGAEELRRMAILRDDEDLLVILRAVLDSGIMDERT